MHWEACLASIVLYLSKESAVFNELQCQSTHVLFYVPRWILKCHACYTVTAEIGRVFCPKCGNGGTLRKVAVTVNENGVVLAARRPRITLRGTRVSIFGCWKLQFLFFNFNRRWMY